MLELGDAELELLELVAGDEVELVDSVRSAVRAWLGEPLTAAPDAAGQLGEQLLDRVEEDAAAVTARGHAASSAAAACASRAAPARTARTGMR